VKLFSTTLYVSFSYFFNLYNFLIATTTSDPIPSKPTENTTAIVGASAATGIVLTLLIIGIVYLIRQKKICRDKFDETDPYIDAIPDAREPSGDYNFFDNESTDLSSSSSEFSKPPPYVKHSNEYIDTTFHDNNYKL